MVGVPVDVLHADGHHSAHRAFAGTHHARQNFALGLSQLLFGDSFCLKLPQDAVNDGEVFLRSFRFAAEGDVEGAGVVVFVEAAIGRFGMAGIDPSRVLPFLR